jgi:hypothetical protein
MAGGVTRRFGARCRVIGVAIMADGPLAGVFWRVLNALDYSDAGEFVAGGRGCVARAVVGG